MSPLSRDMRLAAYCFPRPRGDEPNPKVLKDFNTTFSPPARGLAARFDSGTGSDAVFPARAGMSRWLIGGRVELDSFPRPRGDEPYYRGPREITT